MALSAAELSALGQRYHGVGSASPISSNSRYAIVEVGRRLLDLHLPALRREPLRQVIRAVEDLDDAILAPIIQASGDGMGVWPFEVMVFRRRGFLIERIHKEDAASGSQRGAHRLPEPLQPLWRHMREPEAEEDRVVLAIWLPRK